MKIPIVKLFNKFNEFQIHRPWQASEQASKNISCQKNLSDEKIESVKIYDYRENRYKKNIKIKEK